MDMDNEHTCQDCGYYRQHYIWREGQYIPISGHCVHPPRVRHCRPGMAACPKWIPQDASYRATRLPPESQRRKIGPPQTRGTFSLLFSGGV